jgi:hypothetical protein
MSQKGIMCILDDASVADISVAWWPDGPLLRSKCKYLYTPPHQERSAFLLRWKKGEKENLEKKEKTGKYIYIRRRRRKKKKKKNMLLETSKRAKANEPCLIQSLGEEMGNIIMSIDIGEGNFAMVNLLT